MKNYMRTFATRESGAQIVRLAIIGVVNTIVDFVLFNIARGPLGFSLFWSITLAFGLATFMSYVLNRRWTFGLSGSSGGAIETVQFFVVNIVAWGITVLIVGGADHLLGPLGIVGENVAKVCAALVILLPKFASYRDIVFRKAIHSERVAAPSTEPGSVEGRADAPHAPQRPGDPA